MQNKKHECIIGLLYRYTYNAELVTLNELKEYIKEFSDFNDLLLKYPYFAKEDALLDKVYTLKDYADKRKSTSLERFDYCPICGKKIDWKKIKEEN